MKINLTPRDAGQLLARSAAQLDPRTANRLQSARENALRHQRTQAQPSLAHWLGGDMLARSRISPNWGWAVLLVVVIFGGSLYWQNENEHDHAEIDIAILTDELPVDMYVN